jgi:hypothetical protein
MTTSVVVGSIFLSADQEFRVEQLSVITGADLVDGGGVEIHEDRSRHVFSIAGLCEDSVEFTGFVDILRIWVGTTILLETMLEKVSKLPVSPHFLHAQLTATDLQFPSTVTELSTSLTDMKMKNLEICLSITARSKNRDANVKREEQKGCLFIYLSASHFELSFIFLDDVSGEMEA